MSVTSPVHETDPRQSAIPDTHGHAKGEHKPYAEERPIPYSARMLFLWFYHACRRGYPRFLMVADHMNSLTFEDPAAVHAVRRAIKHAEAGDLYGAAEIANVEVGHAAVVHEGITRRGMRYSIGAEVDNDPRSRPDAQNIVDAMKPDAMIRSVHFLTIPHPVTGAADYQWPFDNPEFVSVYETLGTDRVWELYMEQLLLAIESLPGHIMGHFYVPAKFGHWPSDETLEAYEDRFVEACATHGKAIELNTRFFYRYRTDDESYAKYRGANLRLLRKAKAASVGIAVGSDAHSPKDQGRSFEEALSLLDEAEVNELVFPIAGRLRTVALRATKELLEEVTAPAVAPPAPVPTVPEPAAAAPRPDSAPVVATPIEALPPEPVPAEAEPAPAPARDDPDESSASRPKRATPKRPAGASSKRTTPGPAKGDAPRGEARNSEPVAPAAEIVPDAAEIAAEFSKAEDELRDRAKADAPAAESAHAAADVEVASGDAAAGAPEPVAEHAAPAKPKPKRPAKAAAVPVAESEAEKSSEAAPVAAAPAPAAVKNGKSTGVRAPVERVAPAPAGKAPAAKAAPAKAAVNAAAPAPATAAKTAAPKASAAKAATAKTAPTKAAVAKAASKAGVKTAPPKPVPSKPGAAKAAVKAPPAKKAAAPAAAKKTAAKAPSKPAKAASKAAPVKAAPKGTSKVTAAPLKTAKPAGKVAVKAVAKKSSMKSAKKPAAKPPVAKPASVKKKPAAKKKTAAKSRR